jgi:hypothetical protein
MKKIFTLLTAFMASLTAMSAQAQLSEPIKLSDTTYLADGNNRTALYCTLADGTKLFFNSNIDTTKYSSGYFFLTLNRIESSSQALNLPGDYVYLGHRTSLNRVLVINGEYLCDFQEITVPEGTEVFLLPATIYIMIKILFRRNAQIKVARIDSRDFRSATGRQGQGRTHNHQNFFHKKLNKLTCEVKHFFSSATIPKN